MRLYVDRVGRVCGVAEYSFAVPGFLLVAVLVVYVKASEENLPGVFSAHLFCQGLEQRLLGLASRATLTGQRSDIDDPELLYKLCQSLCC